MATYLTPGGLPGCFSARGLPLRAGACGADGVVTGGVAAGGVAAGGADGAGTVGTAAIDGGMTGAFEITGAEGVRLLAAGGVVMGRPCGAPDGL